MLRKSLLSCGAVRMVLACLIGLVMGGLWQTAVAAEHFIPVGTNTVDCNSYGGGIRPGDSVTMRGTSRGPITFRSCVGTSAAPIEIRNDKTESGPLVVSQSESGFQTQCIDCEHVVIDGTGKWTGAPAGACGATVAGGDWELGTRQCGIILRCTGGSPHSGLRLAGSSRFVTIKGVEIDGNTPTCSSRIGLSINDHDYKVADHPGEWREGIRVQNNYIHDTGTEGLYFGPNQSKEGAGDLPLRNNDISNNYVDRAGCDGINYKSAVAGSSSIHHNYVANTGQAKEGLSSGCSANGIALFEAGFTEIYGNYVESQAPKSSGPGHCISQAVSNLSGSKVDTVPVKIYNNVVRDCKGKGITVMRSDSSTATPVPTIYNNTIVAPRGGAGIAIASSVTTCTVRDNIVAGDVVTAGQCAVSKNLTGTVDSQKFRDASGKDFRLTAASPAVNGGSSQCPSVDQVGMSRPQGGACDQGALEFVDGPEDEKPNPPHSITVQ